jgi:hypothetical protein
LPVFGKQAGKAATVNAAQFKLFIMKKLKLKLDGMKEMLTKEQMKKISGGYGPPNECLSTCTGDETCCYCTVDSLTYFAGCALFAGDCQYLCPH